MREKGDWFTKRKNLKTMLVCWKSLVDPVRLPSLGRQTLDALYSLRPLDRLSSESIGAVLWKSLESAGLTGDCCPGYLTGVLQWLYHSIWWTAISKTTFGEHFVHHYLSVRGRSKTGDLDANAISFFVQTIRIQWTSTAFCTDRESRRSLTTSHCV